MLPQPRHAPACTLHTRPLHTPTHLPARQELAETLGLRDLNARLGDPACAGWYEGLFPVDSSRNMRFAINFFTSIGLGGEGGEGAHAALGHQDSLVPIPSAQHPRRRCRCGC